MIDSREDVICEVLLEDQLLRPKRWQTALESIELGIAITVIGLLGYVAIGCW